MKAKTADVREAFSICDSTPTNPVLDSSQFVRLKQVGKELTLSLTGTVWTEAQVACAAEGKWSTYVDRRVLKAFLATASDPDIEFFYKDKLVIKSGQRLECAVPGKVPSGYESWTPKGTFDLSDEQKLALRTAIRYLPVMAGTENLEAVAFRKGYGICASDSKSVMVVLDATIKSDFFLPNTLAAFLTGRAGKISKTDTGVGVVLAGGTVYQPLSAELDKYPIDKLRQILGTAQAEPVTTKFLAGDFAEVLKVVTQFLLDKGDVVSVQSTEKGLVLFAQLGTGKFQRTLATIGTGVQETPVPWPVRDLLPWATYAAGIKADQEIEYAKIPNANVLRFKDGTRKNIFVFSDI